MELHCTPSKDGGNWVVVLIDRIIRILVKSCHMLKLVKWNWSRLAEMCCIQKTAEEELKFSDLKSKPSLRLGIAIAMILLSYLTCWPLIALLGVIAVKLDASLIFSIGSPSAYVFSHLLFVLGILVAGSEGAGYIKMLIRRCISFVFENSIGRRRSPHSPS